MQERSNISGQKIEAFFLSEMINGDVQGNKYRAKHDNGNYYTVKHVPYPSETRLKEVKSFFKKDQILTDNFFAKQVADSANELEKIKSITAECAHLERIKNIIVSRRPGGYPYDIFICTQQYKTLVEYIAERGLSTADALRIAKNALDGLRAMHDANVLHGNINSDSIVCGQQNSFVLGNFSAIRPDEENIKYLTANGTNAYMSPETIKDGIYDEQSEVYSIGMVIYLLFNNNKFPFGNAAQTIKESANGIAVPLPARATEDLGQVLIKAIVSREERYKDTREFYEALETAQSFMDMNALSVSLFSTGGAPAESDGTDVISLDNPVINPMMDEESAKESKGLAITALIMGAVAVLCVVGFCLWWIFAGNGAYTKQQAEKIMSVELSETEMEVRAGSKFVIPLSEIPETDRVRLQLESSDPDVAEIVNDNEIQAISPGITEISIVQDKKHTLATIKLIVNY